MTCPHCRCPEPDPDAPPCWCLVCDCSGLTLDTLLEVTGRESIAIARMEMCRAAGAVLLLPVARR